VSPSITRVTRAFERCEGPLDAVAISEDVIGDTGVVGLDALSAVHETARANTTTVTQRAIAHRVIPADQVRSALERFRSRALAELAG